MEEAGREKGGEGKEGEGERKERWEGGKCSSTSTLTIQQKHLQKFGSPSAHATSNYLNGNSGLKINFRDSWPPQLRSLHRMLKKQGFQLVALKAQCSSGSTKGLIKYTFFWIWLQSFWTYNPFLKLNQVYWCVLGIQNDHIHYGESYTWYIMIYLL